MKDQTKNLFTPWFLILGIGLGLSPGFVLACGPYHDFESRVESVQYSAQYGLLLTQEWVESEKRWDWNFFDKAHLAGKQDVLFWTSLEGETFDDLLKHSGGPRPNTPENLAPIFRSFSEHYSTKEAFNKFLVSALDLKALTRTKKCSTKLRKKEGALEILVWDNETQNSLPLETGISTDGPFGPIEYTLNGCLKTLGDEQFALVGSTQIIGYSEGESDGDGQASTRKLFGRAEQIVRLDPNAVSAYKDNIKGFRAIKERDYPKAKIHLLKSLEQHPGYQHANFNYACLLALTKQPFSQGKPYLDKIMEKSGLRRKYIDKIKTDPDLEYWRTDKAFLEWTRQYANTDVEEPSLLIGEKVLTDPKKAKARSLNGAGLRAYYKKQYATAIKFFKEALSFDPQYHLARINLASVYTLTGESGRAISELKIAYQQDRAATAAKIDKDKDFKTLKSQREFQRMAAGK